jgi:voltage-gated potassium channel
MLLILGNAVAFVVATIPTVGHDDIFYTIEAASSGLFLIEYALRVYVAPEDPRYERGGAAAARLRYAATPRAIIDAAATFPFFVELATARALPNTTVLRLLRVFRILKTGRATRAVSSIYRVLWYNAEVLSVGGILAALLIFFTAMLLYYLRPRDGAAEQIAEFESLPATLYLALLMLCGQGQPDGPLPWYTQAVVALTACFSIAFFAIPASMLTWGFEAEAERLFKKAVQRRRKKMRAAAENRAMSDSSDEEDAGEEEWHEYEGVVMGDDDSENEDEDPAAAAARAEAEAARMAADLFRLCDADSSGQISMDEMQVHLTGMLLAERTRRPSGGVEADGAGAGSVEERLGRLEAAVTGQSAAVARIEALLARRGGAE